MDQLVIRRLGLQSKTRQHRFRYNSRRSFIRRLHGGVFDLPSTELKEYTHNALILQLSFISEPSPSPEYHHIPITKCLIYDPWLEPIPSPGPVPLTPPEGHSLPRMLIINSEPFTLWKDHFARLQSIAQASEGTLITLRMYYHSMPGCRLDADC